jgi:hypothetical protein
MQITIYVNIKESCQMNKGNLKSICSYDSSYVTFLKAIVIENRLMLAIVYLK